MKDFRGLEPAGFTCLGNFFGHYFVAEKDNLEYWHTGKLYRFEDKDVIIRFIRLLEEQNERDDADVAVGPAYNFYLRVKAEEPMEPVSGETIVLPTEDGSEQRADEVITASRENYAVEWKSYMPSRAKDASKQPDVKVANSREGAEKSVDFQARALDA